jgi:hypothetical protein
MPSRDAGRSHSRGRSRGDGGCGTNPLARYRLAPRRPEITFCRRSNRAGVSGSAMKAIVRMPELGWPDRRADSSAEPRQRRRRACTTAPRALPVQLGHHCRGHEAVQPQHDPFRSTVATTRTGSRLGKSLPAITVDRRGVPDRRDPVDGLLTSARVAGCGAVRRLDRRGPPPRAPAGGLNRPRPHWDADIAATVDIVR